jgi:dihydrofolate reductase
MKKMGQAAMPGMQMFAFSRTLAPRQDPDVTIVGDDAEKVVDGLRRKAGKDIWLFGGGSLFRSYWLRDWLTRLKLPLCRSSSATEFHCYHSSRNELD